MSGPFSRGEVIRILSLDGVDLAHGVASYSSEDLQRIMGLHSDSIITTLGYTHGANAIHRDDCIITFMENQRETFHA